ncbi:MULTISPECIES: hypothetical protein [Corallococcus]|uniref:hypothetical protein n=1 Tax=Corallococcus TaxID=83461 RepID=UPI00186BC191|nr:MULTISPECIES: hypothetical protein [Corallococcus]MCY1032867.1 hypothetical protein [Corallococcus sp. BB11-1]
MAPVQPDVKPSTPDIAPPETTTPAEKPSLMARFKALLVDYGPLAIVLNYVIFGLVIVGFWAAIRAGFQPQSTGAQAGAWGAAYIASQAVKPLRLAAVFVLTPLIARIPPVGRFLAKNKHKWSF